MASYAMKMKRKATNIIPILLSLDLENFTISRKLINTNMANTILDNVWSICNKMIMPSDNMRKSILRYGFFLRSVLDK